MRLLSLLAVVMSILSAVPALGQASCSWQVVGQGQPFQPGANVNDMVEFGGDVYVANYDYLSPFNGTVHRWNATAGWTLIGNPTTSGVHALAVFDDGNGAALYGASRFDGQVVRWDGSSPTPAWTPVGGLLPDGVTDLRVLDDGNGMALYAIGGAYASCGTNFVSRWNATASMWGTLGTVGEMGVGGVRDLVVFDDGSGSGPALFAVHRWNPWISNYSCSGPGGGVSKWNPLTSSWDALAWSFSLSGALNVPTNLVVFDDGSGPALYVGREGGHPCLARWNGTTWVSVSAAPGVSFGWGNQWGIDEPGVELEVFDDGTGPGIFASIVGLSMGPGQMEPGSLEKWDGQTWFSSVVSASTGQPVAGTKLTVIDDGTGPALWMFGYDGGSCWFNCPNVICTLEVGKLDCNGSISLSTSQPGGTGTPLYVSNANLTPGREYHNLVSIEPCPGGPMSFAGPYGSCLSSSAIQFLLTQLQWPVGYEPFHFIAPSSYVVWPALTGLPAITVDALCIEMTNGMPGAVSGIKQIVVQ